ncbi:hypothetical protein VPH35_048731 [Triticum aestivum]
MARACGGGLKHIHLYMHETFTGPNATLFAVVPPLVGVGDNTSMFGLVGVLDDELRDGPHPSNSSLVGRFQSLFAFAGLVTPPGMQTATSLVFTAGEHAGYGGQHRKLRGALRDRRGGRCAMAKRLTLSRVTCYMLYSRGAITLRRIHELVT